MRRKDSVGTAFFFIVIAFVLTMSILMSVFFSVDSYIRKERSNIPVYLFCKQSVGKEGLNRLVSLLKQARGVLRVKIIDKKLAFKEVMKKLDIDRSLFDKNPFPYSIEVFFEPDYTDIKHFEAFKKELLKNDAVDDVRFPAEILKNMQTIQKEKLRGMTTINKYFGHS